MSAIYMVLAAVTVLAVGGAVVYAVMRDVAELLTRPRPKKLLVTREEHDGCPCSICDSFEAAEDPILLECASCGTTSYDGRCPACREGG